MLADQPDPSSADAVGEWLGADRRSARPNILLFQVLGWALRVPPFHQSNHWLALWFFRPRIWLPCPLGGIFAPQRCQTTSCDQEFLRKAGRSRGSGAAEEPDLVRPED